MEKLNILIFRTINSYAHVNTFLDAAGIACAVLMPYFFVFLLSCLFLNRKTEPVYYEVVLMALCSAGTVLFCSYLMGLLCFHPRPFMVSGRCVQLISHVPENSFPSDHTSFTAAIAFILIFYRESRGYGITALCAAVLCGIARVFCGVHFPFDIAGGFLLALWISVLIFGFRRYLAGKRN